MPPQSHYEHMVRGRHVRIGATATATVDPASFNAIIRSETDPAALKAQLQAQINSSGIATDPTVVNAIATYNTGATAVAAASGAAKAAGGTSASNSEIAAGFTLAAEAAAIIGGATLAAASAIIAPMAAVVFGGGYAIGLLIRKIFGITNQGPIACSSTDPNAYPSAPGAPGWIPYDQFNFFNNSPGLPATGGWQPYTNGAFETYARPIVKRTIELLGYCKPLPGAVTPRQFYQGLIDAWNKMWPGVPMRTIYLIGDPGDVHFNDPELGSFLPPDFQRPNTSAAHFKLLAQTQDPIQQMLVGIYGEQHDPMDRAATIALAIGPPRSIQVADPPAGSTPTGTTPTGVPLPQPSTALVTVAIAVPVVVAGGTIAYSLATGHSVGWGFTALQSLGARLWRGALSLVGRRGNPLPRRRRRGNPRRETTVQTLLLPRDRFTPAEARRWATSHGFHARKTDVTDHYVRLRQKPPGSFARGSFRTISFGGSGIKAVVGHLR